TRMLGDVLSLLHPTPAVCGLPKEDAFRFIIEKEGYDRSYYSGFVGWLSPTGQTDIYVNLRCVNIHPDTYTLFAGGGLLASSDLEDEWEETIDKMKTMQNILE
ncbi:MAG TPA: isochorismate synthase, partial [Parabacteroides sp.]|nr:isochorismate synthase [Parabacteroides sp.]